MSSLSYQDQNELYEQITEQLASGRSEPKVFGINRIKVEIAERLVAKVPVLLQKEYKDHLLMAVDLKFQELREEIFRRTGSPSTLQKQRRFGTFNVASQFYYESGTGRVLKFWKNPNLKQ